MNLEQLRDISQNACLLIPDQPVLVGVSGGPDSLCLLDSLAQLRYPLIVAHFDHMLRAESTADALWVETAAGRLNMPFVLGRQDVAAYANDQRLSLEEAARILRYRFLFEQARAWKAQAVAVGHTADDQVETVLMHMLRGAGLSGLAGMTPRSIFPGWDANIPLVRPLLSFWRAEIMQYCHERNLEPIQDASNQSLVFLRNRLRHELIPLLENYNPRFRQALWRMARVLQGDEAVIQTSVDSAWADCLESQAQGRLELSNVRLKALPTGLVRGVLRRAIQCLLPALRDVDFSTIERVENFIKFPSQGQIDLVHGLCAYLEGDILVMMETANPALKAEWPQLEPDKVIDVSIPGSVDLPSGWRLVSQWIELPDFPAFAQNPPGQAWEAWLEAADLPEKVVLRCGRPGDRFQPLGMSGHSQKLSDFWINHKVPRRARPGWPLLTAGEGIVWVPGFQISHSYKLKKDSRKALYLRLLRES